MSFDIDYYQRYFELRSMIVSKLYEIDQAESKQGTIYSFQVAVKNTLKSILVEDEKRRISND